MDVKQLEYFLALVHRENISGTADLLHISQPALSKSISKLEKEIGLPLFDRHGNRITLNEYGRTFAAYAEQSLALLQNGIHAARQTIYETNGVVRIVCYAFSNILLPVLSDYRFLNPNVKIALSHHITQEERTSEQTDLLLCCGQDNRAFFENSSGWVSRELFREPCRLLISRRYREYPEDCAALPLRALKDDVFVSFWGDSTAMYSDVTFKLCQAAGFTPRVALETNDHLFKVGMVGEGRAVMILPECCVESTLRLYPDLRAFSILDADTTRPVYLLRRKKNLLSEAALDFWNFTLEHYGLEPDAWD